MKYIENIKKRVIAAENRAGIAYTKTDSKYYKWVKALYYISLAVSFIMSTLYVLGRLNWGYSFLQSAQRISLFTNIAVLVFWVAAFIFMKFKKDIVAFFLTLIPGAIALFALQNDSRNTAEFNVGINQSFWFRHFIPVVLAVLFVFLAAYIRTRQVYRFKRAYNNMVNRIYAEYRTEDLTEEQWESFLKQYNPRAEEEKRRRKNKKAEAENSKIVIEDNENKE